MHVSGFVNLSLASDTGGAAAAEDMTAKRVAKKLTSKEMRGLEKRAFEPTRVEDVYCYR